MDDGIDELNERKALYDDFLRSREDDRMVKELTEKDAQRVVFNLQELREYERSGEEPGFLAARLMSDPMPEVSAFQAALTDIVVEQNTAFAGKKKRKFFVGFEGSFGAHSVTPRGLSSQLLGKMVMVEGIVSKCSLVHPKVTRSVHYCPTTSETVVRSYRDATSIDGTPTPSTLPTKDEEENALVTEFGLCTFKNNQKLGVQEMPERAPTGQLPRSIDIILDDDLVDSAKPGDRVRIVGIYRAIPRKDGGSTSGFFSAVLLANHVRILSKESLMPKITEKDLANIKKLAKSRTKNRKTGEVETVYHTLARSIAPSIYGHEWIKRGLLCLLLGGVEKNLRGGSHLRGDINLMLVGDPSCGKSQLLRYVQNTAPHCITTTGRGSSGVGLTAAVTTDQDTGERRLEAGAMVLADRGIVCIDEFDKMSEIDRVAIHEVMEQQTVTISKANIHASLNARCSVVAAANPIMGQYDPYRTPMQNIALPDSLLSRFDLLFIVLDKMDPQIDRKLADHVLQSHLYRKPGEPDGTALRIQSSIENLLSEEIALEEEAETGSPMFVKSEIHKTKGLVSNAFLKKYIMYAKRIVPRLSQDACDLIVAEYSKLRSHDTGTKTLPVTPRTLETMIRLATAHAKCHLRSEVTEDDAWAAMSLVNFSYFNSHQPRKGGGPKKDGFDSDDDDDDDGGDGDVGAGRRSAKKKARTPKKSPKRRREGADDPFEFTEKGDGGRSSGQRRGEGKRARVSTEDDGAPAERRTPRSKPRSASKSPSSKKGRERASSPAMDTEQDLGRSAAKPTPPKKSTATAPAPATPKSTGAKAPQVSSVGRPKSLTDKRAAVFMKSLRKCLQTFDSECSTDVAIAHVRGDASFSQGEIDFMLGDMADKNQIFIAEEGNIFLL